MVAVKPGSQLPEIAWQENRSPAVARNEGHQAPQLLWTKAYTYFFLMAISNVAESGSVLYLDHFGGR